MFQSLAEKWKEELVLKVSIFNSSFEIHFLCQQPLQFDKLHFNILCDPLSDISILGSSNSAAYKDKM